MLVYAEILLAFFPPHQRDFIFSAGERFGVRPAQRKGLAIASVAVAAILIRLSMLPWVLVPVPEITNKFSYLLTSDTLAHGRLTKLLHPMWVYPKTFHPIQLQTAESKYSPA